MIGGPFRAARLQIDRARAAPGGKVGAEEDVIDAQAEAALESIGAVIPPGERALLLRKQPERVFQSEAKELPEGLALGIAAQDLSAPYVGVVDVLVSRRDVVVAENRQARRLTEFPLEPVAKGREPSELIFVLLRSDGLSVGHVRAYDADRFDPRSDRRGDHALLVIGEIGDPRSDGGGRVSRQYRHAVVRLLTGPRATIASGL